jgi:CelD/BcsL family acetyltransferase involved in cellulose biosynthesis
VNEGPVLVSEQRVVLDDELATEWDGLADRTRAAPFLRPGWFELWSRSFPSSSSCILIVREQGRLEGVLPLVRRRRAVVSMTNDHTPGFDLIAGSEGAALALARELFAMRANRVTIDYIDGAATGMRALRTAARASGYRTAVRGWERPPYVNVEGSWEAYERGLDGKLRRDLARRRRRLGELGSVSVEVHDGAERLAQLLEEGFALEPSGWKNAQSSAIVSRPETREFYTGLARWGVERGILRLSFLRLDERPIAFQFGLEDGGAYFFVKGGYDPAHTRLAPAKLLLQALLQRAFSNGLSRFEFLGPAEGFKLEWTSTCHDLMRFDAFGRTPFAIAEWAAVVYGRPAAATVSRALRRGRRRKTGVSSKPVHS